MHVFHVPNLTCGGCAKAVTSAIQKLDPEARVDVDVGRREVRAETAASEDALLRALEARGYPASPLAAALG